VEIEAAAGCHPAAGADESKAKFGSDPKTSCILV
jgi:hypothetical protein